MEESTVAMSSEIVALIKAVSKLGYRITDIGGLSEVAVHTGQR